MIKKLKILGLTVLMCITVNSINLLAGIKMEYPKDGKADKTLGYRKLENSFGVLDSLEDNTIVIRKGEPIERIFGAAHLGEGIVELMRNNTVIIDGGILKTNGIWEKHQEIRGGSAYGAAGYVTLVTENKVIIKGNSIVEGNIYGGYSHRGSAINNRVIIEGNPKFGKESILFGGRGSRSIKVMEDKVSLTPSNVITGNTLEIRTKNVVVKDIKNFEKVMFVLSLDKIKEKDRILVLTNTKGSEIQKPEKVKLSDKVTHLSEEEKEKVLNHKNKDIDLKIEVEINEKTLKNVKNLKVILISNDAGLKLEKLPENINKTEKGYKYSVNFQKDSKNLYAIINTQLIK